MDTSKLSQDKKGVDPEEVKGLSKTTEDSCETAVIDPNKIITKDSLRLHMPGAEESELEKDAAGLNYVAGLSGQVSFHTPAFRSLCYVLIYCVDCPSQVGH